MDVHCSTCGEPWDTWHLWQDAIYDTALSLEEADAWRELPRRLQLFGRYRAIFGAAGWEFGDSLLHVKRCPGCIEAPPDRRPDPEREAMKTAIVELLGDDEDAIAANFEEEGL